jgi:hypothetical protein
VPGFSFPASGRFELSVSQRSEKLFKRERTLY